MRTTDSQGSGGMDDAVDVEPPTLGGAAGGATTPPRVDQGGAGSGGSGGVAGAGGAPQPVVGDPVKGQKLVILDNCYRCHGDTLAGRSFYPNITPDLETGIGSWTDKQIANAVRGAIAPNGEIFCATMPLYSGFKDQEVADLIAFLRSVPAVKNQIVSVCPGHNP